MVILTKKEGSSWVQEEYPSMHDAIQHTKGTGFTISPNKSTTSDYAFLKAHGLTEEEVCDILDISKKELVC